MVKRGQVTIFIILGIIIVVIISLLIYIRSVYIKEEIEVEEVSVPVEVESVKSLVESCLKVKVNEALDKLYLYGGYLEAGAESYLSGVGTEYRNVPTVTYDRKNINHLCPNYFRPISFVEDDLENNEFEAVGCEINEDISSVDVIKSDVTIRDDKILVSFRTDPISIVKGESSVSLDRFFVEVPSRFGEIYQAEIANRNSGDDSWVYKITHHVTKGDINDYWFSFWQNALLRKDVVLKKTSEVGFTVYKITATNEPRRTFYFAC